MSRVVAKVMFSLPAVELSSRSRSSGALYPTIAEVASAVVLPHPTFWGDAGDVPPDAATVRASSA